MFNYIEDDEKVIHITKSNGSLLLCECRFNRTLYYEELHIKHALPAPVIKVATCLACIGRLQFVE